MGTLIQGFLKKALYPSRFFWIGLAYSAATVPQAAPVSKDLRFKLYRTEHVLSSLVLHVLVSLLGVVSIVAVGVHNPSYVQLS